MHVIMQPRPNIFTSKGGDTTQLVETARALRKLGVHVDICIDPTPDLRAYDLVHLFNSSPYSVGWTYRRFRHAQAAGKPTVLSTIYWPWDQFERNAAESEVSQRWHHRLNRALAGALPRDLCAFLMWLKRGWRTSLSFGDYRVMETFRTPDTTLRMQRELWQRVDMLLPNSQAECKVIAEAIGGEPCFNVVPNGVDVELFSSASPDEFVARYGIRDFVLCAAGVNPRKNQIGLIRAVRHLPVQLVLIGDHDNAYGTACMREAESNVVFLDRMPQRELASAYAAAKVHVLASYYETPGLANLEAALAGCNIVSTNRGCTREYFGEFAWYCDPNDVDSIAEAVASAYYAPYQEALAERIFGRFTWLRAAQATLDAYRQVLNLPPEEIPPSEIRQ